MKYSVKDEANCKKTIAIDLPEDAVKDAYEKSVARFCKEAEFSGFRKGKAPRAMVEGKFSDEIRRDILEHIIPDTVSEILDKEKINPVTDPVLTKPPQADWNPPSALELEVSAEVHPEITLKKYKGFKLKKKVEKVKAEEIEKVLSELRERSAQLVPVSGRKSKEGDFLGIELKRDDQAPQPLIISLDEKLHPEFSKQLTDVGEGDIKKFSVSYENEYPDKAVAGKTVNYEVSVSVIKEKRLPEINDEFAKQIINTASSLKELKAQIEKDMSAQKEKDAKRVLVEDLVSALIEANPLEIPQAMTEHEMNIRVENFAQGLAAQGMDLKNPAFDWKKIREEGRASAERRVRARYLLLKIAETENIKLDEERVSKEFEKMAEMVKMKPEELRRHYEKNQDTMASLRARLREELIVDFLLENSKVSVK